MESKIGKRCGYVGIPVLNLVQCVKGGLGEVCKKSSRARDPADNPINNQRFLYTSDENRNLPLLLAPQMMLIFSGVKLASATRGGVKISVNGSSMPMKMRKMTAKEATFQKHMPSSAESASA